ncbi:MAG: ATP-binding protein [Leptolyngbyaceae cyanobacterium]
MSMSANRLEGQSHQDISSRQPPELLQRLDFHLENVPLAVIEWNRQLRVTRWSRGAEVLFGWQAQEVLGCRPGRNWHFIYRDDRLTVLQTMGELFRGKAQRNSISYRNYTKDGQVRDCEWYNSVMINEGGGVDSILSLVLDVTRRKQAEAELQQQTLRSQLLAETTLKIRQALQLDPILQTAVDTVQQLLSVDRVLIYHLRADGAGQVVMESRHPEINALVGQVFCQEVFPPELYQVYQQGTIRVISDVDQESLPLCHAAFLHRWNIKAKVVVPLLQGQTLWGLMILHHCQHPRNWTAAELDLLRQLADQMSIALAQVQLWMALRESEERFNQLTESIQEVFWIRETHPNQVLYVSSACEQIWGCTPSALYQDADAWLVHLHPDDQDRVLAAVNSDPATEYDLEYRILKPNGETHWIRDRAFWVKDQAGQLNRITGLVEDITDRKQLEMELVRTVEKERAFSEMRSRFVSMVSHEFRTPLSTILSASELLEYYGHTWTQAERIEQLHLIQDTVQDMTELLEDMLVLGRIEAERLEYAPLPLDLTRFCIDLVAQLQSSIAREHFIELKHYNDRPLVMADEKLLRQILINLLSNAVKYSPAGGTIQFELTYDQDQIILQVNDQGIGIPEADLPRLFEAFYRAKNVGTVPGTGLGLAIVKHCVDAHHGQIHIKTQVGVGSSFRVTLPLIEGEADSIPLPELS